jgi:hypothetical protein
MCKSGRKSKYGKCVVKMVKRRARRTVKLLIKEGNYDNIPTSISVPYTD